MADTVGESAQLDAQGAVETAHTTERALGNIRHTPGTEPSNRSACLQRCWRARRGLQPEGPERLWAGVAQEHLVAKAIQLQLQRLLLRVQDLHVTHGVPAHHGAWELALDRLRHGLRSA